MPKEDEFLFRKRGMTQIFAEDGRVIPATILSAEESFENKLNVGDEIAIVGKSKGKGFAGVVKRWGFAGGPKTHGQSDRHRRAGSIGAGTDPGRIWKGQKMAGRMGNTKVTIKGLSILALNNEGKNITVSGSIPGARKSQVLVKKIS